MKTSSNRPTSKLRALSLLCGVVAALAMTFASAQQSASARDRGISDDAPVPLQGASCGDNRCDPPEDCNTCARDCGSCCGDNRCAPPEDCNSCERDCGRC